MRKGCNSQGRENIFFYSMSKWLGARGDVVLSRPLPSPSRRFYSLPFSLFLSYPSSPSFPLDVGPLNPAKRSGERYKLPRRSLEWSFSLHRIFFLHFKALKYDISWQQF